MTVRLIEHATQIAEINASRDAQAVAMNAERLSRWADRYPHDVVPVPVAAQPPSWPAQRTSVPSENVVAMTKKRSRT